MECFSFKRGYVVWVGKAFKRNLVHSVAVIIPAFIATAVI